MFRFRWLVLALTAGFLALGVVWGGGVFDALSSGGFDDPKSESSRTYREINTQLGRQDVDVIALYSGDDAQTATQAVSTRLQGRPEIVSVVNGPPSNDGTATYLAIQLREGEENGQLDDLAAIEPLLQADEPVTTQVGGLVPFLRDANTQISKDIARAEIISLPLLLILLIFIFRGVVAALMPLMVGGLAVIGAFTAVRLLTQVTEVSVFAINIITMLGLGMAIDYSLFIVSRFREELAAGKSTSEAISATLRTAGRTVLISGLTVVVALSSLLVFPLDFLKSMAWGGMSAVLVAMLAATTAMPAMLAVLGPRVNALRIPLPSLRGGGWAAIARAVMRRPVIYAVGVTALLLAMAVPFLRVQLGGFDERVLPAGTESRVVSERMNHEFGGADYPISVLVNGPVADLPGRIADIPYATGVQVAAQSGDATLLAVSYAGEPTTPKARELVGEIRDLPTPEGTHVLVGGRSAADVDQIDAFGKRLPWMLLLIAASTFLLLFLAFGSVILPLKAIVMNVISIGASFGVVVWIFQDGHFADQLGFTTTGFIEPSNLVLMLAVLFGLATDYEVFLLSRVRESWVATGENTEAVAQGLQRTGGIITAAALLLVIVIGGFATGGTVTIKLLGIGVMVAVAVDATLVRVLLVPATMRLLGRWNWWAPKPLAIVARRFSLREA